MLLKLSNKYVKIVLFSLLSFILLTALSSAYITYTWRQALELNTSTYTIKPGWTYYRLLKELKAKNKISTTFPYKVLLWLKPEYRALKAGTFVIKTNQGKLSFDSLIEQLLDATEYQQTITFIEGHRWRDWLRALQQHSQFDIEKIDTQVLIESLALPQGIESLEGLLLPNTYSFSKNTSTMSLLGSAVTAMKAVLAKYYDVKKTNLSRYEILILASIIEKETAIVAEMPTISSVFHNRLKKKMRLQTDPTVIYGLGDAYNGDITRAHLRQKTAYNTYKIDGLPPTPIAMPSEAAIIASINPSSTPYYYFVANGKGGHQFSTTLKQHNKAVAAYLAHQRKRSKTE